MLYCIPQGIASSVLWSRVSTARRVRHSDTRLSGGTREYAFTSEQYSGVPACIRGRCKKRSKRKVEQSVQFAGEQAESLKRDGLSLRRGNLCSRGMPGNLACPRHGSSIKSFGRFGEQLESNCATARTEVYQRGQMPAIPVAKGFALRLSRTPLPALAQALDCFNRLRTRRLLRLAHEACAVDLRLIVIRPHSRTRLLLSAQYLRFW